MPNKVIAKLSQNKKLFEQNGLTFVGVFGSQSRGDQRPDSDIDIMIDFDKTKSLFELARINLALEVRLDMKVDLVQRGAVKPTLKPYIDRDLITVYSRSASSSREQVARHEKR